MKIWIDIKNSHEPAFFKPFLSEFSDFDFFISSRRYAEIQKLLDKEGISNMVIGRHHGGNIINKMIGLIARDMSLYLKVPAFDVSLHHNSVYCAHVSKLRQKKSIGLYDNDISILENRLTFRFLDYLITPKALPLDALIKHGAREENIIQYNGFKEDVYVADFKPDLRFLDNLPFKDFVTIRPESMQAAYIPKRTKSIVPDLIKKFDRENVNILFLPRYKEDMDYVKGTDAFIPNGPLKGLDVCWYSKAVLTGAGTFAREAACMGTPAVSFYPSEFLLAVDKKMIEQKKIFHSRDVNEIVDYVINSKKAAINIEQSKKVQKEVLNIVDGILESIEQKNR